MIRRPVPTASLIAAVLLAAAAAHAAFLVLADGDFDDAHWDVVEFILPADGGGSSVDAYLTIGHGGNPDALRTASITLGPDAGDGALVVQTWNLDTWDPAMSGQIDAVDAGLDLLALDGSPERLVVVVEQAGALYGHVLDPGADPVDWTRFAASGLVAADFPPLDPTATGSPDFSASGAPLRFGFATGQFRDAAPGTDTFFAAIDNWSVTVNPDEATGVDDGTVPAPTALTVLPNPFNPRTTIVCDLPRAGRATLRIHDLAGRRVTTLLDEILPAGRRTLTWDGRDAAGREVASGAYLAVLETAQGRTTTRMTLVR